MTHTLQVLYRLSMLPECLLAVALPPSEKPSTADCFSVGVKHYCLSERALIQNQKGILAVGQDNGRAQDYLFAYGHFSFTLNQDILPSFLPLISSRSPKGTSPLLTQWFRVSGGTWCAPASHFINSGCPGRSSSKLMLSY